MDKVHLEPCPNQWCERVEGPVVWPPEQRPKWNVICLDCGVQGPVADTEAEAITAWNTRPTPVHGEELVEKVAQSLWDSLRNKMGAHQQDLPRGRSDFRDLARAALSAMPDPVAEIVAWVGNDAIREWGADTTGRDGTQFIRDQIEAKWGKK